MEGKIRGFNQTYHRIPAFSDLEFGPCGARGDVVRDIENAVAGKPLHYDPANFETYEQSVRDLVSNKSLHTIQKARAFMKSEQKQNKILYSGPILLWTYRQMCKRGEFDEYNPVFDSILRTKTYRSLDGVLVVTVFMPGYPEVLLKKGEDPLEVLGDSIEIDMDVYTTRITDRLKKMAKGEKVYVDYDKEELDRSKRHFSCKFDCHYCPSQEGMPRSYLEKEPGVKRATDLPVPYDILQQVWTRLDQYFLNGHPIDKLEVLVLGGTFNSYPRIIRERFIQGLVYAANTFFDPKRLTDPRPCDTIEKEWRINRDNPCKIIGLTIETRPEFITHKFLKELRHLQVTRIQIGVQHTHSRVLDRVNRGHHYLVSLIAFMRCLNAGFKADAHQMPDLPIFMKESVRKRLDEEIRKIDRRKMTKKEYQQAVIDIEDSITWDDLDHTKSMKEIDRESYDVVLYGRTEHVVTLDDIIEDIQRVSTDTKVLLRHYQLMDDPDLVAACEKAGFKSEKAFCILVNYIATLLGADQKKHYIHEVVDWTRTKKWYEKGIHRSYFEEVIFPTRDDHIAYLNMNVSEKRKYHLKHNPAFYFLCDILHEEHPWVRVNRLVRDIPHDYIKGGTDCVNYRQVIENAIIASGKQIHELRHCEKMARPKLTDEDNVADDDCHLMAHRYSAHGGIDYFICFCNTKQTKTYAFLRLRISNSNSGFDELIGCGKVRELHVYGQLVETDVKRNSQIQHRGLGAQLLDAAEFLSLKHGKTKMSVIAGNGTYLYYNKFGYTEPEGSSFMIKELDPDAIRLKEIMIDHHTFPKARLRVVKRYQYMRLFDNHFIEKFDKEIVTDYRKRPQVIDYRIKEAIQRKQDSETLQSLFDGSTKLALIFLVIYLFVMIYRIVNGYYL